jgi:hypothetical protein
VEADSEPGKRRVARPLSLALLGRGSLPTSRPLPFLKENRIHMNQKLQLPLVERPPAAGSNVSIPSVSYKSINEHTIGIVFLGTPHRGSEKASYGKILANIATTMMNKPTPRLISALQVNSGSLMRLTSDFKFQLPNYHVVSFYETRPMKIFSTPVSLAMKRRRSSS